MLSVHTASSMIHFIARTLATAVLLLRALLSLSVGDSQRKDRGQGTEWRDEHKKKDGETTEKCNLL